jgi:hypothetical protein
MGEELFLIGVRGFAMGDAEKMPLTILGANESVVVDVPPFFFSDRWIVDFVESTDSKCRLGRGCSDLRWTRHQSPGRGKAGNDRAASEAETLQNQAAGEKEFWRMARRGSNHA